MADTAPPRPARRRHGAELEAAILEAGWAELRELGYARLTMASVATRAHTSEPVLYRRWANKDQLVLAVFGRYRETHPLRAPDTGSLRGDLLGLLTVTSQSLAGYLAIVAAASLSGLSADSGMSPAEMREQAMGAEADPAQRPLYQRAIARGELDPARVPTAVLAMPFDLVRNDLLMALEPLPAQRIRAIVDELFLPLVRAYGGAPQR